MGGSRRRQVRERKRKQCNTHNNHILRRDRAYYIAGAGPGIGASMRRKRGEVSATHHPRFCPADGSSVGKGHRCRLWWHAFYVTNIKNATLVRPSNRDRLSNRVAANLSL